MILKYGSIENMIAKVFRDTGIDFADIVPNLEEWIPEAMDHMNVQLELHPAVTEVPIHFHAGDLPCGIHNLFAVSFCGKRLRSRRRDNHPQVPVRQGGTVTNFEKSIFVTDPRTTKTYPTGNIVADPSIKKVYNWPIDEMNWYQIRGGKQIYTSFPEGNVTLHHDTVPCDSNGMPFVPDHPDLREAIYLWVRLKLVECGLFKDNIYSIRELTIKYETYSARALENITYPTPDEMEAWKNVWVSLIQPADYWENFSDPGLPEQMYDGGIPTNY